MFDCCALAVLYIL